MFAQKVEILPTKKGTDSKFEISFGFVNTQTKPTKVEEKASSNNTTDNKVSDKQVDTKINESKVIDNKDTDKSLETKPTDSKVTDKALETKPADNKLVDKHQTEANSQNKINVDLSQGKIVVPDLDLEMNVTIPKDILQSNNIATNNNIINQNILGSNLDVVTPDASKIYQNISTNDNESVDASTDAIIKKIMSSTIPSDDFEDLEADLNTNKEINPNLSFNTKNVDGKNDDFNILHSDIQLKHVDTPPGASAVTTGQSSPIPEQSIIEDVPVVKEGGIFTRFVSSLFKKDRNEDDIDIGSISTNNNVQIKPNHIAKSSPLDDMMYSLKMLSANKDLPKEIQDQANAYIKSLSNPVDDLVSVNNWLNFVTGPLSPSSPQALALHQWAFFILCIRFQQLGKSVDKFLKKNDLSSISQNMLETISNIKGKADESTTSKMLDETLGQVERLQQLTQNNNIHPLLNRYIPIPPNYEGGREGSFNIEKDEKENAWNLNFVFDIKDLGAIEIKAVAKLPEVNISVVTSNLKALQKVQDLMSELTYNLQQYGLTTRNVSSRLGRVKLPTESKINKNAYSKKDDGSVVSVDI